MVPAPAKSWVGGRGGLGALLSTRPVKYWTVGILRPGNAGSNTAADYITLVAMALAQLPVDPNAVEGHHGNEPLCFAEHSFNALQQLSMPRHH